MDDIALPLAHLDLVLLQAVADSGTLDGAARGAGLAPSAAVRRISHLERRLGGVLVTWEGERIQLTCHGLMIHAAGRRLLAALAQAVRQISGRVPTLERTPELRLAVFGGTWDAFADDLAVHVPGVLLALRSTEPVLAGELLDRRVVDAAYVWQAGSDRLLLTRPVRVLQVLEEPLWICLPAGHRCAGRPSVGLAELAADDWIVASTEQSERLLLEACAAAGFVPRIAHQMDSAPARSLIGHGRGLALAAPLTLAPAPGANIVLRPLIPSPRRRHLLIADPEVVGRRLANILRTRLRSSYRSKALAHNPGYLKSGEFPVSEAECRDHPAIETPPAELAGGLPWSSCDDDQGGVELEDVHLLRVIGQSGSLNRAAPILRISQPALSRRIQRLERRIGVQLLLRGFRGTRLAPAAYQLLNVAADAESALRGALLTHETSSKT